MTRPIRLRIIALFASLALLLPDAAFARARFICAMMGRVSESACCCGEREASSVADLQAKADRPDCCARVKDPSRSAAPGPEATRFEVPAVALVAVVEEPAPALPRARDVEATPKLARAPPLLGPPLFVSHCSFLI